MSLMEQNKERYLQLKNENDKYIQKKKIIRDLLDKESIKSIFEKVLKKNTDLTNDNIEFLNLLKKSNYDIDIFIDNYINFIAEESVDSENERDEEDGGDGDEDPAQAEAEAEEVRAIDEEAGGDGDEDPEQAPARSIQDPGGPLTRQTALIPPDPQ